MEDFLWKAGINFGIGTAIGFLFDRSKVNHAKIITTTLKFSNLRMMKVFLAASGTSSLVLSFFQLFSPSNFHPRLSPLMVLSNVAGGMILGTGMLLGQGCPGTLWAQLGRINKKSVIGIAGGFTGGVAYSLLYKNIFSKMNQVGNFGVKTINEWLGVPYWTVGLVYAAAMFGVVGLFSKFIKKKEEPEKIKEKAKKKEMGLSRVKKKNLGAVIGGIGIGLTQIPYLFFNGSMLGASTQYITWLSKFSPIGNLEYGRKILSKTSAVAKLALHPGIFFGALLSSSLSNRRKPLKKEIEKKLSWKTIAKIFGGGFLLVFGARVGGGCNSGHGLSGMASQSVSSYLGTFSMFAGGMGLAGCLYLYNLYKKN